VSDVDASVPRPPALFFGRDAELERFAQAMPRVRLAVVYGVGGVGKTAFALRASADLAERLGVPRAYVRCRAGESAHTIAALALAQLGASEPEPRRAMEALLALSGVLVIDDVHAADATIVGELAEYLVTRSDRLYVCIASRATLQLSPVLVDHLVIRLGALDSESVERLWSALESLYGPSERPRVRAALGGNPLLIKRAFAEVDTGEDLLGLRSLSELEAELLVELCTIRQPGDKRWLASGRDEKAVEAALRSLDRRFLVEPIRAQAAEQSASYGVHDIIREAVYASPWKPAPATHARCIERYRARAASDESALIELFYHAARAERDELLLELLQSEASQLRRMPPGSTLLDREIHDSINLLEQRSTLPTEIRLLRARVRARQGELGAAWRELMSLDPRTAALDCARAEVASMLGLVDQARDAARCALDDSEASPLAHVTALAVLADAERTAGRVQGAFDAIAVDTPPLALLGPLLDGVRAWLLAVTLTDCERFAEAADEAQRARAVLSASFPVEAMPLLYSLERAIRVLLGSPTAPGEEVGELFDENVYFRCAARLLRAQEHLAFGRPRRARELAEQTGSVASELGLFPIVTWAAWVTAEADCVLGDFEGLLGRVPPTLAEVVESGHVPPRIRLELALGEALLKTGNVGLAHSHLVSAARLAECNPRSLRRARALLTQAARTGRGIEAVPVIDNAQPSGYGRAEAGLFDADFALCRAEIGLATLAAKEVDAAATSFGWRELACRARLALAECALRCGDVPTAQTLVAAQQELALAEGYAPALVHAAALSALIARAQGSLAGVQLDELARRLLPAIVRDRSWTRALFARIAERSHWREALSFELLSERGRFLLSRSQLPELDLDAELVVDRERGIVQVGGNRLDLSRRATLLDLLAALASAPGTWLTPAELALSAWRLDYHAVRHHSRLAMSVARLRELIGVETIEGGRDGYRLVEAKSWRVVRPLEA
jgi:hypothetical protein